MTTQEEVRKVFEIALSIVGAKIRLGTVSVSDRVPEFHVPIIKQVITPVLLFANNIAVGLINSTHREIPEDTFIVTIKVEDEGGQTVVHFHVPDFMYGALVGKGHKNKLHLIRMFKPTLWQAGKNQFSISFHGDI